jgi:hypothetical protein
MYHRINSLTGTFYEYQDSLLQGFYRSKPNVVDELFQEVNIVQAQTYQKLAVLKYAAPSHIGIELLHIFIRDLLGRNTPAAKIFISKSEEE